MLAGKWVWIWNWQRCDGGDASRIAARLRGAGCTGALVKAFDGPRWFDQGRPWREIAAELKAHGIAAGGWGYCYGNDPTGEAQRAIETARYGQADLLVLDVEAEFKGNPRAADALCRSIREALGLEYPLYFSSFAIARYHRTFPFEIFRRHCTGTVPQVYWNAFRRSVDQSLLWTYDDYAALGFRPELLLPAGGLYREGTIGYPYSEEVREFISHAQASGSRGVSFWSYEHMSEEMWQVVASATIEEEEEMSSSEFDQLNASVSQLAGRVGHLEADVAAIRSAPPVAAPPRTYTVQPGDTLSGIAASFGLDGWQRLYEVNADVIGGDPNRIYPGQVLVIP
jgi:LysM repeat protein